MLSFCVEPGIGVLRFLLHAHVLGSLLALRSLSVPARNLPYRCNPFSLCSSLSLGLVVHLASHVEQRVVAIHVLSRSSDVGFVGSELVRLRPSPLSVMNLSLSRRLKDVVHL